LEPPGFGGEDIPLDKKNKKHNMYIGDQRIAPLGGRSYPWLSPLTLP